MQIKCKLRHLLTILVTFLCCPYLSVAMETDALTFYRTNMLVKKELANDAADAVRLAHAQMIELGSKYDPSQEALSIFNSQFVYQVYSVTKDVFTGGNAGVLSGVVSAFTSTDKSEEEKKAILAALAGTPLVDAYTSAIENKKSALSTFDSYVAEYNAAFTAWSELLREHDKSDEHEEYSVPTSHASDRLYTWKS